MSDTRAIRPPALVLALALAAAGQVSGPPVGAKIPAFEGAGQDGRPQTFETIRGPKGAVLVFFRSADW
jgi:hypothetical protein